MTLRFERRAFDGKPHTFRPAELIVALDEEGTSPLLAEISERFGVPAEVSLEDERLNEIRRSVADDWGIEIPSTAVIGGLDAVHGPETSDMMFDLSTQDGVWLNRVMFLGTGSFGRLDDPSCCAEAPVLTARQAGGNGVMKLNPWYADPWYADPWYADAHYQQMMIDMWKAVHGEDTKPPWATTAKKATAPDYRRSQSDEGVARIWILDTGLPLPLYAAPFLNHPDRIVGDRVDRPDHVPGGGDGWVDPVAGHGGFIAGIYEQLAPGCDIDVRAVIGAIGDVDEAAVAASLTQLAHAAKKREHLPSEVVINLSFGSPDDAEDMFIRCYLDQLNEAGAVIVSSAGNDGSCMQTYPAHWPSVISVGALDGDDIAEYSNRGGWINIWTQGTWWSSFFEWNGRPQVPAGPNAPTSLDEDLGAPYQVPHSTVTEDLRAFPDAGAEWSGTSFAAPAVGAAIAHQMRSTGSDAKTAWTAVDNRGQLTGHDCAKKRLGPQDDVPTGS